MSFKRGTAWSPVSLRECLKCFLLQKANRCSCLLFCWVKSPQEWATTADRSAAHPLKVKHILGALSLADISRKRPRNRSVDKRCVPGLMQYKFQGYETRRRSEAWSSPGNEVYSPTCACQLLALFSSLFACLVLFCFSDLHHWRPLCRLVTALSSGKASVSQTTGGTREPSHHPADRSVFFAGAFLLWFRGKPK